MCSTIDLCFLCSKDNKWNKCNVVDNKIVTQVEYLMPEIRIIKLRLPLRICSICEKNLQLFNIFKQNCVENSLRLEARIKETKENTDVIEKCTINETNINKSNDVCIKEELFDKSDNLEEIYSLVDEICIKEHKLQENPFDCEFGSRGQESPLQTDTHNHLHEANSVDMDNESDQNSNDPELLFSINNEINTEENILVTGSPGLKTSVNEVQYNTGIHEKCTTSGTNINKIHEVYIKEEELDGSDTVKDFFVEEIYIKENPLQENLHDPELQDTLKEDNPPQIITHLHEGSNVDMDNKSDQNSDVDPVNEIDTLKNILVTGSPGRKTYTCLICNKGFKDLSYVKYYHMKIHTGKKEFQCNECNKWFSRKSSLAAHIKQHTGAKDFQCNECKKCFLKKYNLVAHMIQHTGVKNFQCSECKKWFTQKSTLVRHMKQHSGVKNFQCNECKKWFSQKVTLVRHMKVHAR